MELLSGPPIRASKAGDALPVARGLVDWLKGLMPAGVAIFLVLGNSACTPAHTIRPLPDFVQVGIEPGDRVHVTKNDGDKLEFEVTRVETDALVGPDVRVFLSDIRDIKKRSWEAPDSPCGDGEPLGCSVPWYVSLTSESHERYRKEFHDACVQHDYCYRHGYVTYGHDREACDDEFLENMLNECPEVKTTLGRITDALLGGIESMTTCQGIAEDYHSVVRRFGEDRFKGSGGSYCEYDGPLQPSR